jgi:hypothetical protein
VKLHPVIWLSAIAMTAFSSLSIAAIGVERLQVDLAPLIDTAVRQPTRFAVDVPHQVSSANGGHWNSAQGVATWTYAIQIPTAVSISFHAARIALPAGARLTVSAGTVHVQYGASNLRRGELWSRVFAGDTLKFKITVPTPARSAVQFEISSLQAGYRGFGGRANHPHFDALMRAQASALTSTCVQNYSCNVTPANTAAGQATVALTVGNVFQCTGTLLNDVPGDGAPYILTARHCQTGQYGGGDPSAAASVVVYWNAVSPCGAVIDSIYDTVVIGQVGAITLVEQQDMWLITLDQSPLVSGAYFAGFDATGGVVQGGYSVHQALSYNKQYVGWYGQAFAVQLTSVLGSQFISNFWEVVNQIGNIGAGASGSGLFDQNNRLVGSLSLGRTTTAGDAYEACPASPPPVPNGSNGVADFNALSAVWTSTADTTSSTGTVTLQSVLDPLNAGVRVVDSVADTRYLNIHLSSITGIVGQVDSITWVATGATQCTASGGLPGDLWTGSLAASGTVNIVEQAAGTIDYTLTCTYPMQKPHTRTVRISWVMPAPVVNFTDGDHNLWVGAPDRLSWTSTVGGTCSLTGGTTHLTGLPSNGSTVITAASPGMVHYVLACASGGVSTSRDDTYITPSVVLVQSNSDLLLGEQYELTWQTLADTCAPSGGTAGDGWGSTPLGAGGNFLPHITTAGVHRYGITCTAGSVSLSSTVSVHVASEAPYATLSTSATTIAVGQPYTVTWKSNLTFCNTLGGVAADMVSQSGSTSDGSATYAAKYRGTYSLTFQCTGLMGQTATSGTVTVKVVPNLDDAVTITPASVELGQAVKLAWQTNNATSCTASGGGADGKLWSGALALPAGTTSITTSVAGTFTYTMNCIGQLPSQTQKSSATVTVKTPTNSGGGGGGAMDRYSILVLIALLAARCRRMDRNVIASSARMQADK